MGGEKMKKKMILKVSGAFSAAVLSICFLYNCSDKIYRNIDFISKIAAKNIFYLNYENKTEKAENNIYIEKDEIKIKEIKEDTFEDASLKNEETQEETPIQIDTNAAEMTISGGSEFSGISIKIGEDTEEIDFEEKLNEKLDINTAVDGSPTVLLYHTHTCECYDSNDDDEVRSTDNTRNVVGVGEAIKRKLESYGIGVIHDTTIYDTTYNGSYYRSEEGVLKILEENPQIEITIDIHRDSLLTAQGEKIRPIANINGKRAAQIMIISGCDPDGSLGFPNWRENLKFSLHLQKRMTDISPSLPRPLYYCNRVYNMYLTNASILIEVGTDANYPNEAFYAGELFGEALAKEILENSK